MAQSLEAPGTDAAPAFSSIYRARGDDVIPRRPIFTGDVFFNVAVEGEDSQKNVMILQHPCAIRRGPNLAPKLLVAEVRAEPKLMPSKWATGYYRQLPLADLVPDGSIQHYAAFFDYHQLIRRENLLVAARVASMSQLGVNLTMQRWVHHNSRVIIPTQDYQIATGSQFEEADIVEEWCVDREEDGVDLDTANMEIDTWLTGDRSASAPRVRLQDAQQRSAVRREVRLHLRILRT